MKYTVLKPKKINEFFTIEANIAPELLAKTDPEAKAGAADAALEAIPVGTEAGSEFLAECTSENAKDAGAFLEGFY